MSDDLDSVRISLRLANGEFFPLFHFGGLEKRTLSLVPAIAGQGEVDVHFFHHPADGSVPREMGVLCFPNLSADKDLELNLAARINPNGLLSVTLTHKAANRSESAEFPISEITELDSPPVENSPGKIGVGRWILGVLFVLVVLALILWATFVFAGWGRQDPEPRPLSYGESYFWKNTV